MFEEASSALADEIVLGMVEGRDRGWEDMACLEKLKISLGQSIRFGKAYLGGGQLVRVGSCKTQPQISVAWHSHKNRIRVYFLFTSQSNVGLQWGLGVGREGSGPRSHTQMQALSFRSSAIP